MPTLRERFENLIAGPKLAELEKQVTALGEVNQRMVGAYLDGPYVLPPDELVRQLRENLQEYDPQLMDQLIDMMNYERIGGYGGSDESERARAVADSRQAFKYSILARYAVNLWTSYALGANVQIVAEEESAEEVWTEFQDARRNKTLLAKDRIDELSRWLLVTGERFLAYYASTIDGETTVRSIQPEQITRILTNPDDSGECWFYERKWQLPGSAIQRCMYYVDWETSFNEDRSTIEKRWALVQKAYQLAPDARRAEDENSATTVVMQFIPFIQLDEDSPRGWPLLAPHGTPWFRAHRDFMQNRLAVSRGVASYIRRYKVAGGSRAVDAVRQALGSAYQFGGASETNPVPAAGSSEVMNRAIDTTDLPLRTGASDAKDDGEMFSWYALLSVGIFPHYAGMGDAYRLATASAMEKPIALQFSLYRNQLSSMFREMVEIVLRFKEQYGSQSFQTYAAQISTDRMVNLDAEKITESLSRLWRDVVTPLLDATSIPQKVIDNLLVFSIQSTVEALGQDDPEDMVNLDMFQRPSQQEAAALSESHTAEMVERTCPLCSWPQALAYPDHNGLLVCAGCGKTYDPEVE